MTDITKIQETTKDAMQKSIERMEYEFHAFRTGKATPSLVDNIQVEVYGSMMRIRDLAAINVPEPRMLIIQPWDKSTLSAIDKAIKISNLGIMPMNDGNIIRLPMPELSEERRKKLVKDVKDLGEKTRINIRTIRRDSNELIKKAHKDSLLTEDTEKDELDKIQKLTDNMITSIDKIVSTKEHDLMSI